MVSFISHCTSCALSKSNARCDVILYVNMFQSLENIESFGYRAWFTRFTLVQGYTATMAAIWAC